MSGRILSFLLWLFIWFFLSWPPNTTNILIGILVAFTVYFMTKDFFSISDNWFKKPSRFFWFLVYIIIFIKECLKASLDVAYRIIHPSCLARPGTIRVKTSLKSEMGLTLLANTLSLTAGNMTIDIDRECGIIYIHRLHLGEFELSGERNLAVVENYEKILRRIFE